MSTYLSDSEFGTPNIVSAGSRIEDFAKVHGLEASELATLLADVAGDLFPDPEKIEENRVQGGKDLATTGKVTTYGTPEYTVATEKLQSRSDQLSGARRVSLIGQKAVEAVQALVAESETPAVRLVPSEVQPGNDTIHTPEIETPHAA